MGCLFIKWDVKYVIEWKFNNYIFEDKQHRDKFLYLDLWKAFVITMLNINSVLVQLELKKYFPNKLSKSISKDQRYTEYWYNVYFIIIYIDIR